ncbi:unnamed protein product [Closterium sp. NIES-53]
MSSIGTSSTPISFVSRLPAITDSVEIIRAGSSGISSSAPYAPVTLPTFDLPIPALRKLADPGSAEPGSAIPGSADPGSAEPRHVDPGWLSPPPGADVDGNLQSIRKRGNAEGEGEAEAEAEGEAEGEGDGEAAKEGEVEGEGEEVREEGELEGEERESGDGVGEGDERRGFDGG